MSSKDRAIGGIKEKVGRVIDLGANLSDLKENDKPESTCRLCVVPAEEQCVISDWERRYKNNVGDYDGAKHNCYSLCSTFAFILPMTPDGADHISSESLLTKDLY